MTDAAWFHFTWGIYHGQIYRRKQDGGFQGMSGGNRELFSNGYKFTVTQDE